MPKILKLLKIPEILKIQTLRLPKISRWVKILKTLKILTGHEVPGERRLLQGAQVPLVEPLLCQQRLGRLELGAGGCRGLGLLASGGGGRGLGGHRRSRGACALGGRGVLALRCLLSVGGKTSVGLEGGKRRTGGRCGNEWTERNER